MIGVHHYSRIHSYTYVHGYIHKCKSYCQLHYFHRNCMCITWFYNYKPVYTRFSKYVPHTRGAQFLMKSAQPTLALQLMVTSNQCGLQ